MPLHVSLFHVQAALFGACAAVSGGRLLQLQPLREHRWPRHLRLILVGAGLEYEFIIYPNPHALPATRLPQSLLDKFNETCTYSVKGTDPRRPAPVL